MIGAEWRISFEIYCVREKMCPLPSCWSACSQESVWLWEEMWVGHGHNTQKGNWEAWALWGSRAEWNLGAARAGGRRGCRSQGKRRKGLLGVRPRGSLGCRGRSGEPQTNLPPKRPLRRGWPQAGWVSPHVHFLDHLFQNMLTGSP